MNDANSWRQQFKQKVKQYTDIDFTITMGTAPLRGEDYNWQSAQGFKDNDKLNQAKDLGFQLCELKHSAGGRRNFVYDFK